jgi:acyl-CoA synthetase (AMP-forming)/AMP-acid ligase II
MTIPPNTMHSDIGRRTLPAEIDRQAKVRPEKIVHSVPISSNLADGYRDVTILEFAKAIDRACEYLEPLIGTSNTLDTVAYYGPPDLRYLILIIAVNKLGFKLLASAPRNSLPMHLHLLNITDCRIILHARQIDVSAMVGTHEAARHPVPDLAELLWSDKEPRHYPYTKTFDEVKNDPYFVLHTSGSTGMPKPILHRHSWAAIQDIFTHMPPVNGMPTRSSMLGRHARIGTWFPPWHVGGSIMLGLAPTIFGEKIDVWPPADCMPSGKANMEMVEYGRCQEIVNGPSVYAEIVNDPELYEKLGMLERVWYGGGESFR